MTAVSEQTQGPPGPTRWRKLTAIPVRSQALPAVAGAAGCESVGESGCESACDGGGLFALQVLGDDMAPEFDSGDIIVAEADGAVADGAFVVARAGDEWVLRRLVRRPAGWCLVALNPAWPEWPLVDLAAVRGVVIQKSRPGRRRSLKRYG